MAGAQLRAGPSRTLAYCEGVPIDPEEPCRQHQCLRLGQMSIPETLVVTSVLISELENWDGVWWQGSWGRGPADGGPAPCREGGSWKPFQRGGGHTGLWRTTVEARIRPGRGLSWGGKGEAGGAGGAGVGEAGVPCSEHRPSSLGKHGAFPRQHLG